MGVPEASEPHKADPRRSPFSRLGLADSNGAVVPPSRTERRDDGEPQNGPVGTGPQAEHHQNGHPPTNGKWSREEIRRATADARDQQLAELVVLSFGLAAERYPDIIQSAIAKVFDLSAVEENAARIMATLSKLQADISEARRELQEVRDELKRVRK